jgi:hypothetical protein
VRVSQVAALGRFWHPQIMPDFSSPQTCIKPYENRSRSLINAPFLPTLKPEEPFFLSSDTLESGSTSYSVIDDLTTGQAGTYKNPRIEVPQYINSMLDVPVWEQYLYAAFPPVRSLIYWNVPQ